jgi:acyl dehydratase
MTLKAAEVEVGQVFEQVIVDDLKRTQIVQYAGAGGDYNPLHTDHVFAVEAANYPRGTFAHGMLTMGMTARLITDLVGLERLTKYGGRFTAQVWPGDTLTARVTVEEIQAEDAEPSVSLKVSTTNQDGLQVFVGYATARIDP